MDPGEDHAPDRVRARRKGRKRRRRPFYRRTRFQSVAFLVVLLLLSGIVAVAGVLYLLPASDAQ
jgi:hypothetical protein